MSGNTDVALVIGGTRYAGWKNVSIERGLDTLAASFSVGVASRIEQGSQDLTIAAGSACIVEIDGEKALTGWIDRVDPGYDAETHGITITGRDKTCDLVDCSAVHKTGSWRNATIEAIAAELAKPFGIKVTAKASTGAPLRRFALQQGETVHEAIERALRYRGLMMVSTADGDVEIVKAATGQESFKLDLAAILSGSATHDVTERFSKIIVKGQSSGDDGHNGKAAAGPKAEADDKAVKRYRPLIVIGEEQSDNSSLGARAKFEVSTRAGRSQRAEPVLQGWRRGDGKLWLPNQLLSVTDARLFLDSPMLVERVALSKGEDGSKASLSLVPPEAWSQQAVPEEREAGRVKKGKGK